MVSLGSFREQRLTASLRGLIPAHILEYRPSVIFAACAFTVLCALLLGGGTHGGFLSDAILELIAIPPLLIAVSSLATAPSWRAGGRTDVQWVLAFCCVIALIPLIQLVPLPPWLWTHLPGRAEEVRLLELAGGSTPWMPISVSSHATWLSFLSLLPPMAVFLAAIQLSHRERRYLSLLIIAFGVVSVFIGLTQVAQGQGSPWRFYAITNPTEAVGFFANRNHFAAYLYAVLLFAAVWAIEIGFRTGSLRNIRTFQSAGIFELTAMLLVFVAVIAGESMARSRAGLALTIVSLIAIFALVFRDRRNVGEAKTGRLILLATVLAIILSLQFGLYRIFDRFASDPLQHSRLGFAHNTFQAAKSFMPFGSGMGTFVPVYAMFERPIDVIPNTYINHAHDDILELWLETGVLGPALICLFVIWLVYRGVQLWRRPPPEVAVVDNTLARAATVVISLFVLHSFVDYPMRTEAIMAIFAVSCALLIEPLHAPEEIGSSAQRRLPRRHDRPSGVAQIAAIAPSLPLPSGPVGQAQTSPQPRPSQAPAGRWGEDVEWPKEWRGGGEGKPPGSGGEG